jgi:protein-S-isoprenylcysteine O-methyltransferase Ste14
MPYYAYLQLLFFISELFLLILRRSKKGAVKNNRDRRSLLILWLVIGGCLGIGPYTATYHIWAINNTMVIVITGVSICIAGFIIRWTAILQLGKMFTVDVVIADHHTLKTTGLYKIVRHPSYLGLILIVAGLEVCTGSAFTFLIIFIPVFMAMSYRIAIEEKALTEEFGDQYKTYKTKVKKLIPGVY